MTSSSPSELARQTICVIFKTHWSQWNRTHWQPMITEWKNNGYFFLFLCQTFQRQKSTQMASALPASRSLMIAGAWSMSSDTLSSQLFSRRKRKTPRRVLSAAKDSAFLDEMSSGWYFERNHSWSLCCKKKSCSCCRLKSNLYWL